MAMIRGKGDDIHITVFESHFNSIRHPSERLGEANILDLQTVKLCSVSFRIATVHHHHLHTPHLLLPLDYYHHFRHPPLE